MLYTAYNESSSTLLLSRSKFLNFITSKIVLQSLSCSARQHLSEAGGWRPQRSERLVALGQFLPGNGQSMSTTEGLLQCLAATQSPDASTRQQAHSLPADAFIALRRLLA